MPQRESRAGVLSILLGGKEENRTKLFSNFDRATQSLPITTHCM